MDDVLRSLSLLLGTKIGIFSILWMFFAYYLFIFYFSLLTFYFLSYLCTCKGTAIVAQLVELWLPKPKVAGSSPVYRSKDFSYLWEGNVRHSTSYPIRLRLYRSCSVGFHAHALPRLDDSPLALALDVCLVPKAVCSGHSPLLLLPGRRNGLEAGTHPSDWVLRSRAGHLHHSLLLAEAAFRHLAKAHKDGLPPAIGRHLWHSDMLDIPPRDRQHRDGRNGRLCLVAAGNVLCSLLP